MQTDNDLELANSCTMQMHSRDRFADHCGMHPQSKAPNQAEVTMTIRDEMLNGHGTCHGGVIFSLADTAFAHACNNSNRANVAMDCRIDFFAPGYAGDMLTAIAGISHQGRKSSLYEVSVYNQNGVRLALFLGRSYDINQPVLKDV